MDAEKVEERGRRGDVDEVWTNQSVSVVARRSILPGMVDFNCNGEGTGKEGGTAHGKGKSKAGTAGGKKGAGKGPMKIPEHCWNRGTQWENVYGYGEQAT